MAIRFVDRFARAQKMMAAANLDLLLIVNRENLIYFTGLTQIECLAVLIPQKEIPARLPSGWMPGMWEGRVGFHVTDTISPKKHWL